MSEPIPHTLTLVLEKRDADSLDSALGLIKGGNNIRMLAENKAFEIDIATAHARTLQNEISSELTREKITADICVQPRGPRKKTLLICDMDSTLIGQECIDEIADFANVKDQVSTITERAMQGEIDFDNALIERVGLLKSLPLEALNTCFKERIRLNFGARTLAQTMAANGAKTIIVSGGFTFFTGRIAKLAGFDDHQANELLHDGKVLKGTVRRPILGREAKYKALKKYSEDIGGAEAAIAIGDGANDLAMITAAGLGVAYYAKPAVAAAAHCGINHTDLTTALYFQGYSENEFVN